MNLWKNKLPNILTISRLIFFLLILLFFIIDFEVADEKWNAIFWWASFFLFLIACLSDFLDGYLARKWKVTSNFGKIMDPICDKLLINSLLIVFCIYSANTKYQINNIITLFPWYFAVLMISRDVFVDGFRSFASSRNIVVAANNWGKLKTVAQMLLIFSFFVFIKIFPTNNTLILIFFIFSLLVTLISVYSGCIYVFQLNKHIKIK